jgi:hypothetical protein
MSTLPGFHRYTDPEGDTLDISPALADINGQETPVAALAINIRTVSRIAIHVPPADVEQVVAAMRAAVVLPAVSGVQPDTGPAMCACDGQTLLQVHTLTGCYDVAPAHEIPLGHSTPSHRVLGWCSHCPGRSLAEEVGAWQVDALDRTTTTGPTGDGRDVENERLRTENERMRHELEVMYGGAFDSPPGGQAEDGAQQK